MLTPEETSELGRLRRLAYAPDGVLDADDARRLQELENRRVAAAAAARAARETSTTASGSAASGSAVPELVADVPFRVDGERDVDAGPRTRRSLRPEPAEFPAEIADLVASHDGPVYDESAHDAPAPAAPMLDDAASEEPNATAAPRTRRRRWLPYVAAVAALAVGFGVGFAVFERDAATAVTLSASESRTLADLQDKGNFDPGSVTPIGRNDIAIIWGATRHDATEKCLVVTVDDPVRRSESCVPAEDFERDGQMFVGVELLEDDGNQTGLQVGLLRTIDGEENIFTQVYDGNTGWDWREQYTPEELAWAEQMVDEGFNGETLQLLGEDLGRLIWQAYDDAGATCILVTGADDILRECTPGMGAAAITIDEPDGSTTVYSVEQSSQRGPYLAIERRR